MRLFKRWSENAKRVKRIGLPSHSLCVIHQILFVKNTAEIQNDLIVIVQSLELVVGHEVDDDVGLVECFLVVRELVDLVFLDVRLDHEDVGIVAGFHHLCDDVFGGGFAEVVDVRLEREAHHGHDRLASVFQLEFQHLVLNAFGAPERFVVVDLAGFRDELGFDREVRGQEVRVDRDAVSADAAAGAQDVHARMLVRELDELPDVDAGFVADQRKFVREGDLHVAGGVFRELAHLGSLGVRFVELALDELAVESDGLFGRFGVDAADHAVVVDELIDDVAGQDAFRAVGDEDLAFELGALLENQRFHLVRRADRGGRLDHVQVAFLQERDDGLRRALDVGNIGFVVAFERSRDDDEVGVADDGRRRGFQHSGLDDLLAERLKTGLHDVNPALIGHVDDFLIDVDTRDVHAVLRGDDGGRKPDVAESHETCVHIKILL